MGGETKTNEQGKVKDWINFPEGLRARQRESRNKKVYRQVEEA